ncbi:MULTISPECIES: ATP-binding protein [unclassified Streptomyces]|uniref:ATP-binding protein n=1 Tax=unclassified Streptomyces TaxID=2593676 RepID=UPI000883B0E6|nr:MULTISPECIES: ATP-binding protein [unclassified Streptomyces]PBC84289.1 anti-sigma regulatory factor (Ser/Thr protein kinase) [Streptomyces sp. 2321.6]SDR32773.1 Anti-sigma regulatory factor (Ser/Thr protein kinase) [Streptomyces sp. KS_16]SED26187.1 Anti-sigma regulatory factor (Ser/Thr protein kinase) [Streptomyces sp. 2133.1]SNC70371.1 Anti-sigma regulatory factor (Ser/Thr protein kinase) [Streptomyces sp. 2114.4]
MEPQHLSFSVPGTTHAAAAARRRLAAEMHDWGLPADSDALHTAELVAGELLSNAVQHAGPSAITVVARCDGNAIRIEVSDSSPDLPRPRSPNEVDEHGRGLLIVAALADRYAVEPTESGKRCWAEIHLRAVPSPHIAPQVHLPRRWP